MHVLPVLLHTIRSEPEVRRQVKHRFNVGTSFRCTHPKNGLTC
jgi:hypothetical protein